MWSLSSQHTGEVWVGDLAVGASRKAVTGECEAQWFLEVERDGKKQTEWMFDCGSKRQKYKE